MLINVKIIKKKCFSSDGRTDGRTDTRTTQNYSSEPHKIKSNLNFYLNIFYTDLYIKFIQVILKLECLFYQNICILFHLILYS